MIGPGSKITMHDRQTLETIPQPAHVDFVIMMALPVSSPSWSEFKRHWLMSPVQLCQYLVPVVVGGLLVLRARLQSYRNLRLALDGC